MYSIPVTQLLSEIKNRRNYINRKEAMHYCSPSVGGWGVVRVACLVPEVEVLFVIPMGCGRHGAIASFANKTNDKLSYMLVEEVDIVTGNHLNNIESAVEILVRERNPRGILICSTCMDDLLGSDYGSLEKVLADKYQISIRHGKMNPILSDTKKDPQLMIQKTIYEFLDRHVQKDQGVNLIGAFVPVSQESELESVLKQAGIGPLRHICNYETYDGFLEMSKSSANLLVHQLGSVAAKNLEASNGQKTVPCYQAFTLEEINKGYEAIGDYYGLALDISRYKERYLETFKRSRKYQGKTAAIGATINARPFELAHFLVELGFDVRYIVAKSVSEMDKKHVEWLALYAPNITILPSLEPSVGMGGKKVDRVDYCFGLDASILFHMSFLVELPFDELLYGYLGAVTFMNRIEAVSEFTGDIIEHVYNANLVV
jgi:nitrogenase molybdenum-cofactor synthesis protein NifE